VIQSKLPPVCGRFLNFDAALAIYAVGVCRFRWIDFMATPASNVMMVGWLRTFRDGHPGASSNLARHDAQARSAVSFHLSVCFVANAVPLITFLFTRSYEQAYRSSWSGRFPY